MLSLTLMRPRLDLPINDLTYRINTSSSITEILNVLFTYVSDSITSNSRCVRLIYQMLSLTLMRPRLDLPINDVVYRINISSSVVSSTFLSMIDIVSLHLKLIIKWPEMGIAMENNSNIFSETFWNKYSCF